MSEAHIQCTELCLAKDAEIAALKAELAKHQESEFHPDWSMLKATRASLKEHQQMVKDAWAERDALREYVRVLREWQDKAFQAHPNIDLDIDSIQSEHTDT